MAHYEVQFTLKTTTQIARDYSTNVWSIFADDLAALAVAVASLKDFYEDIRGLYSNNVEQNGHLIKCYDRSDPVPRAPVLEDTYDFPSAITGQPLPHEVALCLSFQAIRTSGVPQARRRGRVFIGPLTEAAVDTDGRVGSAYILDLVAGGNNLLTASQAASAWSWEVWSGVSGGGVIVADGWVDNAFDTQRRRGRLATSRTTFS